MSEFRKDPVIDRWVIINDDRTPLRDYDKNNEKIETKKVCTCPLCAGNEKMTPPEIMAYRDPATKRDQKGWWIRVIPNEFPALKIEESLVRKGEGLYDKISGVGAHETIIESPEHIQNFYDLSDKNAQDVFWAFRDRLLDLKKDPRFEYILIFKNKGEKAGAHLSHSHSNLIALPIIPKRIKEELVGAQKYYKYKKRCVFCDIIDEELRTEKRIVYQNSDFIAFCPYSSRSPFEVWIMPKKHKSHFCDFEKDTLANIARAMKVVLKNLSRVTGGAAYNFILHNSPIKSDNLKYYHWHIEIIPRIINIAGFERGSGFYMNPISPEKAAKALKSVKKG